MSPTDNERQQALIHILAIEDQPGDILLLREILRRQKRYSFELTHVSLLEKGLQYLSTHEVDVVLLDLSLPDSSGLESLTRLHDEFPTVPVVVLTGQEDDQIALQAVRLGAQDFLVKSKFDSYWLPRVLGYAMERKETERSLRYLAMFADENPNPVFRTNKEGRVLYANKASQQLEEAWSISSTGMLPSPWCAKLADLLDWGVSQVVEEKIGSAFYRFQLVPIPEAEQLYVYGEDVTQKKRAEEKLHYAALHDDLTNLPNRTLFLQNLKQAIARSERRKELNFAVLFVDLDRFKRVNDGLGHQVGDMLLLQIAHRLTRCLRTTDTVARLGGDEFVLLLNELQHPKDVSRVVNRIISSLEEPFLLENHELSVSASIGVVLNDPSYKHPEEYLRDADNAMYRAKKSENIHHAIFDKKMHEEAMHRLQMESALHHSISRDELCLHYQPVIGLCDGQITGFEALVRWQHPELGMIPPNQFIGLAEESDLIVQLGWWVLRRACEQLAEWQELLGPSRKLMMNINVSGRQLATPHLVSGILDIVKETGVAIEQIGLEITESMLIEQTKKVSNSLEALQMHGFKLYMDDFGTGYSSLGYLHRFPVDILKIDRSFVRDMAESNHQGTLVRAILSLAENFELGVVAEGVETDAQLADLKRWNCAFAQGYFFSRPLDAQGATALLLDPPNWGGA